MCKGCPKGEEGAIGTAGISDEGLAGAEPCGGADCGCESTPNYTYYGFGDVAQALSQGYAAFRAEWRLTSGPVAIFLVDGSEFGVSRAPLNKFFKEGTKVRYRAHVDALFEVFEAAENDVQAEVGVYRYTIEDNNATDWIIVPMERMLEEVGL
jgi:hypothetical protein